MPDVSPTSSPGDEGRGPTIIGAGTPHAAAGVLICGVDPREADPKFLEQAMVFAIARLCQDPTLLHNSGDLGRPFFPGGVHDLGQVRRPGQGGSAPDLPGRAGL